MASGAGGQAELGAGDPSRRVWRAVSSSRSRPSSLRPSGCEGVQLPRISWPTAASIPVPTRRMPADGSRRARPSSAETGHLPSSVSRSAMSRSSGWRSGDRPRRRVGQPAPRSRACRRCGVAPARQRRHRAPGTASPMSARVAAPARPAARPPAPAQLEHRLQRQPRRDGAACAPARAAVPGRRVPEAAIGRGGSRQMAGPGSGPSASSGPNAGQLLAHRGSDIAGASRALRDLRRRRPEVAPISRTTSPAIMLSRRPTIAARRRSGAAGRS